MNPRSPRARQAPALTYHDLPDGLCRQAQEYQADQGLFVYLSKTLIDDLSTFLAGRNVVEAYAGRGHLSSLLQDQGVAIKATSLRNVHDRSDYLGHVVDVEDLGVRAAVEAYRDWLDVLLVCWPVTDDSLYHALGALPSGALIVFLGEISDYSRPVPFLGGCATDRFFEAVEELPELTSQLRYPTFRLDQIKVYRKRSSETAA